MKWVDVSKRTAGHQGREGELAPAPVERGPRLCSARVGGLLGQFPCSKEAWNWARGPASAPAVPGRSRLRAPESTELSPEV